MLLNKKILVPIIGQKFSVRSANHIPNGTINRGEFTHINDPDIVKMSNGTKYTFLPWLPGSIASVSCTGLPILSGPFTGCILSCDGSKAYHVSSGSDAPPCCLGKWHQSGLGNKSDIKPFDSPGIYRGLSKASKLGGIPKIFATIYWLNGKVHRHVITALAEDAKNFKLGEGLLNEFPKFTIIDVVPWQG